MTYKGLKIGSAFLSMLGPLFPAAAQTAPPNAAAPVGEPVRVAFSVRQDHDSAAAPAKILATFQDASKWGGGKSTRAHIGGPRQGVGAVHRMTANADGVAHDRTETTIVADERRVVLHIVSLLPVKGITFAEVTAEPRGAGSHVSMTIYCDLETPAPDAAGMASIVATNEKVLASNLRKISAAALATD